MICLSLCHDIVMTCLTVVCAVCLLTHTPLQGPVYAALLDTGYMLPGGSCVGVGVSGFTLGGGLGHATRALGVLSDSVLQATVVLSDGQVVTASPTNNTDIFWVSATARRAAAALSSTVTCTWP